MSVCGSGPVLSLHWDKVFDMYTTCMYWLMITIYIQSYLVTGSGSLVSLWTHDLQLVAEFKGHEERVECVQCRVHCDDGVLSGVVLSGSQDGVVKYWDIKR